MKKYFLKNTDLIFTDKIEISSRDRSFRFGDGIFDTILVHNSKIYNFESHFQRILDGLNLFKIKIDISNIQKLCEELISKNNLKNGFIRIIISRGINPENAVGYFTENSQSYFIIETIEKELPEFKTISLAISSWKNFYKYPCKVNNSPHYVMALTEAKEKGFDNALMLDNNDNICETANGNIFWVKGKNIYTPSENLPFINGTISQKIKKLAEGYNFETGLYKFSALSEADEIFMTNIGGLVTAINKIEGIKKNFTINKIALMLREGVLKDIKSMKKHVF